MRMLMVAAGCCLISAMSAEPADPATWQQRVENDWLGYEQSLVPANRPADLRTQDDAAGGCDGLKNGAWGFHTDKNSTPWWQVDLGQNLPLTRIVVWNRCDSKSHAARATNLVVSLSPDSQTWTTAYQHNGALFYGSTDSQPLEVDAAGKEARFVRLHLPGSDFLHLDEVEVFGPSDPSINLALRRPADQSSLSEWSAAHRPESPPDFAKRTKEVLSHCQRLVDEHRRAGVEVESEARDLATFSEQIATINPQKLDKEFFLKIRRIQRKLALKNPILNFDALLITKRVPGSYSHMSDQYYGWWSRPGGGIYLLRDFQKSVPTTTCLTDSFTEPGSFLRPSLSYDGKKILFAWCKHYPHLAAEKDKLNKANVPEDAFYHVFEMNINGTGARQLTQGKYDNFDARYLPDGRIVFLSTRRGQFIQVGQASAAQTLASKDLPDCYVRCGGDAKRPVAVYTLHTMDADGSKLCAISPFEMFEWEPSIAHDGTILYARWDYIDRDNLPFMSLWSTNPDGTNARLVYGNFSRSPHCAFEPQAVPGSHKILFTASGHHSHTMGSLVLLDPFKGNEGTEPITRLTPEVPFPEIEGWPVSYYASPWPLSERFHLVAWGMEGASTHAQRGHKGWNRWEGTQRPSNAMGIYFFDATGNLELLYRDPEISSVSPIPLRSQSRPPIIADTVDWDGPQEGKFVLSDVYRGLEGIKRGDIKALRIVAVPAKTQPWMNRPELGVTRDDPGKCVLGTVPVEADGSAYFRVPSGVNMFFQALDTQGVAIQTMRTATHVQPGQTLSCTGCHESRADAPPPKPPMALRREPSRISVGPEGSWPLRFDRLVQPVLDRHCVRCHKTEGEVAAARKFDLTPKAAYESLVSFGKPSLRDHVRQYYYEGQSRAGQGPAMTSALLGFLRGDDQHRDLTLDRDALDRLTTWMDTCAQRLGSFSEDQEQRLLELRASLAALLDESISKPDRLPGAQNQ